MLRLIAIATLASAMSFAPQASRAQETAATMPIADLHFHPEDDKFPSHFKDALDQAGVRWFGLGERRGGPRVMRAYQEAFGDRLIAFGGQSLMNQIYLRGGPRALEDPEHPDFKRLVAQLEKDFAAKHIRGIGELFVNNRRTNRQERNRRKMTIDGPVIRTLFDLAARHDGFVAFHMEGDADSVAQLERLAASNRKGRIILNHCGIHLPPAELSRLFAEHSNVYCEFSVRYSPMRRGLMTQMFDESGIAPGWREVFVGHADRIMVGTDAEGRNDYYAKSIEVVRKGLLANLPLEAARKIAYGNAVELFGLKL